jgi:D-inositol-3-phosphate glycosyltransferase
MLSVHTSPLDQPGTGDAGGMNVYVAGLAAALARRGTEVDVYTRATAPDQRPWVDLAPGVRVAHVPAGPRRPLDKGELPSQLCALTAGVRAIAADQPGYDLVHSHYWLSGRVGWLVADAWGVPLVHTMHTMARVKNAALAPGEHPEPDGRLIGEEQVVAAADALVASTGEEAGDLVELYGAAPDAVHVVPPGVDLDVFAPGTDRLDAAGLAAARSTARAELGLPDDGHLVVFAGRIQPLKAPDVLVAMLAELAATGGPVPLLVVLGGPSGCPQAVQDLEGLARRLGVADRVRLEAAVPRPELARWFRAADLVAMPSRSESFGLVAAEAQACATPVVATGVGGLRTVVRDGVSGRLVRGHDPRLWAEAVGGLLADEAVRAGLGAGARSNAERMSWAVAAEAMDAVYERVLGRTAPGAAGAGTGVGTAGEAGPQVPSDLGVSCGRMVP